MHRYKSTCPRVWACVDHKVVYKNKRARAPTHTHTGVPGQECRRCGGGHTSRGPDLCHSGSPRRSYLDGHRCGWVGVRIRVYTHTPALVHDIYAHTVNCGECSWPRPRPIPCIPENLHECKARDLVCSLLSLSSHSCGSGLLDAACLTVPVSFASA